MAGAENNDAASGNYRQSQNNTGSIFRVCSMCLKWVIVFSKLICPAANVTGNDRLCPSTGDDGHRRWSDAGTISTCSTTCQPRVPIGRRRPPHLACERGTHTPLSARPRFPGFDLAKITSLAAAEAPPTRKRWGPRDWAPPNVAPSAHSSANHAPVPAGPVFLGALI